jgi:hypothetical protein
MKTGVMQPTQYYKVNWIHRDLIEFGKGNYNDCSNGFFFASSTHSIFTVMNNIYQYFLEKEGDILPKNSSRAYEVFINALDTALYTAIEITKEEYESCLRLFGEVHIVSGSVGNGGPKINIKTLANFEKDLINDYYQFNHVHSLLPYNLLFINF